jgi:membrane-bound ClpP family serine protease
VLLVVGVGAILLELLMPGVDGFISGVIGIIALVASAIIALLYVPGAWFIVVINAGVLVTAFTVFFTYIKRKQFHGKIILSDALSEDLQQIDLNGLVGKVGKTLTLLRPYGEADFNGVKVEVATEGVMVERGVNVKVKEVQGSKVLVSVVDGN